MVSPLFGWSAGDVVQSIKIVTKLGKAFKKEGGSTSQFADTVAFLDGFHRSLGSIKDFAGSHGNAKYMAEIVTQIKLIDGPYNEFEAYLLKFEPSLGVDSSYSLHRKAPKKALWALKELSEVSGKVSQLKKAVSDPLLCIGPLLVLQSLHSVEEVLSAVSRLPDGHEFTALWKAALDDTTLRLNRVEQQMQDLSKSAIDHGDALKAQGESLARLTQCLSQKEHDMRSLISKENEKNQQYRSSQSASVIIEFDKRILEMQRRFDVVHQRLDAMQAEQSRILVATVDGQKKVLTEIHLKVEESFGKVAKAVQLMQQSVQNAARPNNVTETANWLGPFARQLIASGITSAVTGGVVLLAMRDKPVNESSSARARSSSEHDLVEQVSDLSFVPEPSETWKSPSSYTDPRVSHSRQPEVKKTPVIRALETANSVETQSPQSSAKLPKIWHNTGAITSIPPQASNPSRHGVGLASRQSKNTTKTSVQLPSRISSAMSPAVVGRSEHTARQNAREDMKPLETSVPLPSRSLHAMFSVSVPKNMQVAGQAARREQTLEKSLTPSPSKTSTAVSPASVGRPIAKSPNWLCCYCSKMGRRGFPNPAQTVICPYCQHGRDKFCLLDPIRP